jgi:hypothetical protein
MQEEYGLVGGNIFHGELSLGQMFHARPAAGYADLVHARDGPVPGGFGDAQGRRREGDSGLQRGPPDPREPARRALASRLVNPSG